jgi:subtilisin family serine protease
VKIMPFKVLGGNATGFEVVQAIVDASKFVAQDGSHVRVINMSLGTVSGGEDAYFAEAIAQARAAGVVVVAAAGNDGREVVGSPANTPNCIAVGSTGHYLDWEMLSSFSNHGDRLDISAPGEDILSTLPGNGSGTAQYGYESGTSMASPYVAGVAALVAAKYDPNNQSMTAAFADKIKARLLKAVDDLGVPGWDPLYGAGRLNAAKAVTPATIDAAP